MSGPRDRYGLTAASEWPRGIWAGSLTPETVGECLAMAFTAAVDDVSGVDRDAGRHLPRGRSFREVYGDLGSRLGLGRDAFAQRYYGQRWLTVQEVDRALADPDLGPAMARQLTAGGPCDVSKLLFGYASLIRQIEPKEGNGGHSGGVPAQSAPGSARSRKANPVSTQRQTHPAGVRDAVRAALKDGQPRRPAAVKAIVRNAMFEGVLTDKAELAVSSALSHLAGRGEIEQLPDGRYQRTDQLKE